MINTKLAPDRIYYHDLRTEMLSLVEGMPKRILEIGCASGHTLAYLKKSLGAEHLVGVEISSDVARLAAERPEINEVLVGNIEDLPLDYPENYFDLVIAGHVLEHLVDPWATLRKLVRHLRPGGQVVGAVPNIKHVSVTLPLLLYGRWEYRPTGIMDWTHLRFFTRATLIQLLVSANLRVKTISPEIQGPRATLANRMTLGTAADWLAYAYNFSALK